MAKDNNQYCVYILARERNGTLHIGVTSDPVRRVYEHKSDVVDGFTEECGVHNLVRCEITDSMESAVAREKRLKKWNRDWKIRLIERANRGWRDLYPDLH